MVVHCMLVPQEITDIWRPGSQGFNQDALRNRYSDNRGARQELAGSEILFFIIISEPQKI